MGRFALDEYAQLHFQFEDGVFGIVNAVCQRGDLGLKALGIGYGESGPFKEGDLLVFILFENDGAESLLCGGRRNEL